MCRSRSMATISCLKSSINSFRILRSYRKLHRSLISLWSVQLGDALQTPCAVLRFKDLVAIVAELDSLSPLTSTIGIRYTPGAALLVTGPVRDGTPDSTSEITYVRRTSRFVVVLKHDVLTSDGVLDRSQRRGGWGAVATQVRSCLGGVWTARSRRTLAGTLRAISALCAFRQVISYLNVSRRSLLR